MNIGYMIDQIEQQRKEQDAIYHAVAVRHGLSDTALWILYYLWEAKQDCTQQDLIRQSFFAKQTVNTAVASLVKKGYLILEMIPGTRNLKRLILTAQGKEVANSTAAPLRQAEIRAYGSLPEAELLKYLDLTEKLTISLKREMESV